MNAFHPMDGRKRGLPSYKEATILLLALCSQEKGTDGWNGPRTVQQDPGPQANKPNYLGYGLSKTQAPTGGANLPESPTSLHPDPQKPYEVGMNQTVQGAVVTGKTWGMGRNLRK